MNTPIPLEEQLKSWTPRAPSPALRERLFGVPAAVPAPRRAVLGWLAPVSALVMATLVLWAPRGERLPLSAGAPGPVMAMTLSNETMAAYLPGSFRGQRNHLAPERLAERFGWTKPGDSPSSTPSLTQFRTNFLRR
jgi:hypothetical protein